MIGTKVDILWSPNHSDRFITFGPDLRLYQVEESKDGLHKSGAITVSDTTVATLLSINNENQYMKCVSWYPKAEPDHLLAVGQANGKIVLTSFGQSFDTSNLIGKEFVPKHARQCNSIAWNPGEYSLLASGLDKYRADHGILVWDVMKPPYDSSASEVAALMEKRQLSSTFFTNETALHSSRPVEELGLSETAHSLHWFSTHPKTLVSGMNNKNLKIFDLRDTSKHHNVTSTKAVYGVCVDPFFEHRLASFVENLVVIWDVRNFDKPVVTLSEAKQVIKLSWCPTRCSLLASLTKDSCTVKLYDIQQASLSTDEMEPTVVERCVQPFGQHTLSSISWHLSEENRMMTITPSGSMRDYTVFDRITLNWAPTSEVVWSHGKKILHCLDSRDRLYDSLDDISVKMRKRALQGYGLKMNQLCQNGDMVDEPQLRDLWEWLDSVKTLQESYPCNREDNRAGVIAKQNTKYEGVCTIICNNPQATPSDHTLPSWVGLENSIESSVKIRKYVSKERERALQLCGWGEDTEVAPLGLLLERLEIDGQFARAATISVFNMNLLRAMEILNKGASTNSTQGGDPNLNMVAMALAGYTYNKNALWTEMCSNLRPKLHHPYLRAMFAFLTSDEDSFEEVLNEKGVDVQDRVAFACIYLPDKKLVEFLEKLKTKMIENGNLHGILLTGLAEDGLKLLQRYVDITGDIQTASMVTLHAVPNTVVQDVRVQQWVESYRELLDIWRLWHQRAQFDVHWFKMNPSSRPPQQVFVSCNFCGKSVSNYLQYLGQAQGPRSFARLTIAAANKTKITCCPGCRKPLPRCALCLTHMGTPAGFRWRKNSDNKLGELKEQKLAPFCNWLSWCQSCRHGGHARHLIEWFREHAECPVTGCSCKCMSLDAVAKVSTVND